jgi:hypothetical protein
MDRHTGELKRLEIVASEPTLSEAYNLLPLQGSELESLIPLGARDSDDEFDDEDEEFDDEDFDEEDEEHEDEDGDFDEDEEDYDDEDEDFDEDA